MQHHRRNAWVTGQCDTMKSAIRTKSFSENVDRWVLDSLRAGVSSMEHLIDILPGAYPIEVVGSLSRLAHRNLISEATRADIVRSALVARTFLSTSSRSAFGLPAPHPLDYDWRFTSHAVDDLLSICRRLGNGIICLGAPTVFVAAMQAGSCSEATFIDRNSAVIAHLASVHPLSQILRRDLLTDPLPTIKADVIVADPPWYVEHFRSFLWAATKMCAIGGYVVVSLPPRGTRPQVESELNSIYEWATQLGLRIQQLDEGRLCYETPPFERNALRAAGLHLNSHGWRKGTLCVFRSVRRCNVGRPNACPRAVNWTEATLHGTRLRFREDGRAGFGDPSLVSVVSGDILPSVSRRHRLRGLADVWSSGNRIFRCCAPGVLRMIANALAKGDNPAEAVAMRLAFPMSRRNITLVTEAAKQLIDLTALERAERGFIGEG